MLSVAIGVPSPEIGRYTAFWDALIYSGITREHFLHPKGANVAENRNHVASSALACGDEYEAVLYIDDDQLFAPNAISVLVQHAEERDCDVLSGLYLKREPPWIPHVYHHHGDGPSNDGKWDVHYLTPGQSGIVECDMVGAGFLLVRLRVLRALKDPWWTLGQGRNPSVWADDEDFCRRVREAGFRIWCDFDVPIGHMFNASIWPARQADGSWASALMVGKQICMAFPPAESPNKSRIIVPTPHVNGGK